MAYDPYDNTKTARQRLVAAAFDEAWNLVAAEFHLPNNEADRKGFAKLLAMIVDSHVKSGVEHASDVAYNAFLEFKKKHTRS